MKINIKKIYTKNILNNISPDNDDYLSKFSGKENSMWQFTLLLLKDNYPKEEYNNVSDKLELDEYLKLYLGIQGTVPFKIEEWFEYLKSKE